MSSVASRLQSAGLDLEKVRLIEETLKGKSADIISPPAEDLGAGCVPCEECGVAAAVVGCQTIDDDAPRSLCRSCHERILSAVGAVPDSVSRRSA